MSGKYEAGHVTDLKPYLDARNPKRRLGWRVWLFLALALAAAALIVVLVLREQRAPASGVTAAGGTDTVFAFDGGAPDACIALESGGAAALNAGGLTIYGADGTALETAQFSCRAAVLRSGGGLVLGFDAGGRSLRVMDGAGSVCLSIESEGTLLDADLSADGALCTLELLPGYKSVLTVYDNRQRQTYRYYSSTRYFSQCAISADGSTVCAAALGDGSSSYATQGVLFETDTETPVAEFSLGSALVWELRFLGDGTLCTVTEDGAALFTSEGAPRGSYDCAAMQDYALDGSGFLLLAPDAARAGCALVSLAPDGTVLAESSLTEAILSISAAGEHCAVLTPAHLYFYDKNLNLLATQENAQAASAVILRQDGAALLISGSSGSFQMPE